MRKAVRHRVRRPGVGTCKRTSVGGAEEGSCGWATGVPSTMSRVWGVGLPFQLNQVTACCTMSQATM